MGNFGTITNCSWNAKYPFTNNEEYTKHFPALLEADKIDPVQSAADFYILYGISNRAIVSFPTIRSSDVESVIEAAIKLEISATDLFERNQRWKDHNVNNPSAQLGEIADSASTRFAELVDKLDRVFFEYTNAACGGELRHHKATLCLGGSGNHRFNAWEAWGNIYQSEGPNAFNEMENLFLDFNSGSYGGPAWANAVRLLIDRSNCNLASDYKENQIVFVDRVFNLQHNTGCFLNKLSWTNLRIGRTEGIESFINMADTVLAAHGSNPPDLYTLWQRASDDVQEMLIKTIDIALDKSLPVNGKWKQEEIV
jgi:hypothetical protein